MDDTEQADFVQLDRDLETTDILNDRALCIEHDDEFVLAQNNSECLVDAVKRQQNL